MTRKKSSLKPWAVLLPVFMTAATLSFVTTAASAETSPDRPHVTRRFFTESPDFASESFKDAWDFSQPTDSDPYLHLGYHGMRNVQIKDGLWQGDAQPQGNIRLLQSWSSLPVDRDGKLHPIDASKYTRVSLRMRVTGVDRPAAEFSWYDCGEFRPECRGATGFRVKRGWQTYDLALKNDGSGPVEWAGEIRGFTLVPSAKGGRVEIDWIRLYQPANDPVTITIQDDHPDAVLIWDRDRRPQNNRRGNPDWDSIPLQGKTGRFYTDRMDPGRYFVYSVSPNGRSLPRRLAINETPKPVVLQPDKMGGRSYDEVIRRDAWDFSEASDVGATRNMVWRTSGGHLVGYNTTPTMSDASFELPLVPGRPLNADRFHRLSVRIFYAGNFSLSANPGGGMNGRFVWRNTAGVIRVSEDIIIKPGWNTIVLDLAEFSTSELIEGNGSTGWRGQQINLIRFDPHEDAGRRDFRVDWVRLAEDDRRRQNGNFRIGFKDVAYEPGSTAKIFIDRNGDGEDRREIASFDLNRRRKNYRWTVPSNLRGTGGWFVTVEVTDRHGAKGTGVSTGVVQL